MNADPQLRERLERAAAHVRIDAERRLERIHGSAPRRRRVRRAATVAVAAALGIVSVGIGWRFLPLGRDRDTPGAAVGPTGRIAYMSLTKPLTGKDTSDVFVVDAASGEVTPIHRGTGFSVWPRWSPDGTQIAYASNETPQGDYGIFVAAADGSDPVNIASSGMVPEDRGPISLAWSPDGSRIAYVGGDSESGQTAVWIVNADGTGARAVLEEGYWDGVSWSPDGKLLLLGGDPQTGEGAGQWDLYTVRIDGSDLTRLTDDELVERAPSWSPDGTRIVFAKSPVEVEGQSPDYGQDVFVMDADGSNLSRITDWEGFDSFPVWSPDGKWIAFASDRDATAAQQQRNSGPGPFSGVSIYAMRADGSSVVRLVDGGDVGLLPSSWTP